MPRDASPGSTLGGFSKADLPTFHKGLKVIFVDPVTFDPEPNRQREGHRFVLCLNLFQDCLKSHIRKVVVRQVDLHRKVLARLVVQPASKIQSTLVLEITSEGLNSLHVAAELLHEDQ